MPFVIAHLIFSKKFENLKKSKNKSRPIISFDGFHYQSFVPQATATIPAFAVIFIRLKFMVKSSVQLNSESFLISVD